jgi:NAD(P)-dependent dehydrogenase (short-subunit alcohol dehydrogenase family)
LTQQDAPNPITSTGQPGNGAVVVIGGTAGLGRDLAEYYAGRGRRVVITGRNQERADKIAAEIGGDTTGIAVDLTDVDSIAPALAGIGPVEYLALSAFFRDRNTARDFNLATARDLATIKMVGYAEVVHALHGRLVPTASILLYGGGLKDRPQVGTLTVSTANAAMEGLCRALAVELAPIRVNAIHPGMVADSPFWMNQPAEVREGIRSRTPTGRFTTMRDVTTAAVFLLEHPAINGVNLHVNGGASLT